MKARVWEVKPMSLPMSSERLIKGARICPVTSDPFSGDVLIANGKIKQMAPEIEAKNAHLQDAHGLYLYPGMIEGHCHMGIMGDRTNLAHDNDTNEMTNPNTAELYALDGIKPFDASFGVALSCGVTTVNILPGSANPIGGVGTALKNNMKIPFEKRVLVEESGLKMAFGENPRMVYSAQKKFSSRMGTAQVIRKAFQSALNYAKKEEKERDLQMEALLKVLDKKIKARIHAHRADDICTAIRISEEYGFEITIEHATEAHLIADFIAEKGILLNIGPLFTARYKMEINQRSLRGPGILERAGSPDLCLITDFPVIPIYDLPLMATMAVRNGLSEETALKSITIHPARVLGVADRIGSIEEGKDADLILTDRPLLDPTHRVMMTFVDGIVQYDYDKEGMMI